MLSELTEDMSLLLPLKLIKDSLSPLWLCLNSPLLDPVVMLLDIIHLGAAEWSMPPSPSNNDSVVFPQSWETAEAAVVGSRDKGKDSVRQAAKGGGEVTESRGGVCCVVGTPDFKHSKKKKNTSPTPHLF